MTEAESIQVDHFAAAQADIVEIQHEIAEIEKRQAVFSSMNGRFKQDGNKWCAIIGEMPEHYVAGFGDTPEKAMFNWWNNWCTKKAV